MKTQEILRILNNEQKRAIWESFKREYVWTQKIGTFIHSKLIEISADYKVLNHIDANSTLHNNTAEGILNKLERKFDK